MRLLLLAQFFPPDIGGEERHVFNLAEILASRGHASQSPHSAYKAAQTKRCSPPGSTYIDSRPWR